MIVCKICGSEKVVGFRKMTKGGTEYPKYEFYCAEHLKKHPLGIEE